MPKKVQIKTGEIVDISGQYQASGKNTEATLVSGKHAPPNPGHRPYWTLVDPTKHKKK